MIKKVVGIYMWLLSEKVETLYKYSQIIREILQIYK